VLLFFPLILRLLTTLIRATTCAHSLFIFAAVRSFDSYKIALDLTLARIATEARCSVSPPSFTSFYTFRSFCIDSFTINGSGVMPDLCSAQEFPFSDHPLHRLDDKTNMIGPHIQTPLRVMQRTPTPALPSASSSSAASRTGKHTRAFVFDRFILANIAYSAALLQLMFFDTDQFGIFCNDQCVEFGQYRSYLDVARLVHRFYFRELCVGVDMTGDDLDLDQSVMHSLRRGVGHVVRHALCDGAFDHSPLTGIFSACSHYSLYFRLIAGSLELSDAPVRGRCKHCVALIDSLSRARRKQTANPGVHANKVGCSSHTTFANLTPEMKDERLRNLSTNYHSQQVQSQFHRAGRSISTPGWPV
jgi:hypothetical protein